MEDPPNITYCQVSNIRCTLLGNKIVDHSGVVEALPVGRRCYIVMLSLIG